MECVRKLVYAENTDKLEAMYQRLKEDAAIRKYSKHLEGHRERRGEWAICFGDQTLLLEETIPTIMQSLALGY